MDEDEEDYVFYGTPIEREEDISSRKKKAVAGASGNLRALPSWKQEVTDEEGRRRFHGAFTGGYSAGYYNTVGSKEGWTPQTFTSSRKNRADIKQQNILNFLDDDEKAEMESHSLGTSLQFDTFGFTATELARKQAEIEQQQRPSAIPGPVPDELVLPATNSIGQKLLMKMGWRYGRSIQDSHTNSMYDSRREARKAFLALSSDASQKLAGPDSLKPDVEDDGENPLNDVKSPHSTPVYVLNPKQDLHGLGYDPFKHAPEFREKKRSRVSRNEEPRDKKALTMKDNLFAFKGKTAPGFGIGALEELDAEDEDVYASGYDFEGTYVQEVEEVKEPSRLSIESTQTLSKKEQGLVPGFKTAANSDYQLQRFEPPVIPKDFVPHHKFSAPLEIESKHTDTPPPEVPPPEDKNLKVMIEGFATLVARSGKLFEDVAREKNKSNPLFSFIDKGNGCDYYLWKLWEEKQKHSNNQTRHKLERNSFPQSQGEKMTAESRGKILGEKPLERSSTNLNSSVASADGVQLQFKLSDTFTEPTKFSEYLEVAKPFRDDLAKQERFERFLKEKYQGGLRSTDSGRASNMSEAARARERLDFEAAAEAIQKGKLGKENNLANQELFDVSATGGLRFTAGRFEEVNASQAEEIEKKMYPKREEFQWRPAPILCKRFDLIDPFMGKPPPAPRMRGKMDSLIFTSDFVKPTKVKESSTSNRDLLPVPQSNPQNINNEAAENDIEIAVEAENVERPVDLYKAIFSDDSEDEVENPSSNQVEDPRNKIEVANTTLNRLIAGDFLESLGKELGLEVPPDVPSHSINKSKNQLSQIEKISPNIVDSMPVSAINGEGLIHDGTLSNNRKMEIIHPSVDNSSKVKLEKKISYSSEEAKSRKRSKRHGYSSTESDSDSSTDTGDRYSSRSKERKKRSYREKNLSSSSRKKSKKHKHRSSRHGSGKEDADVRRESRKWRGWGR